MTALEREVLAEVERAGELRDRALFYLAGGLLAGWVTGLAAVLLWPLAVVTWLRARRLERRVRPRLADLAERAAIPLEDLRAVRLHQ